MENIVNVNINGESIAISTQTPFPLMLSEYLYEGDFDLMMADLNNKKEFIEECKKVKFLMDNLPGLTSSFITTPFIFNNFITYFDEFNIKATDLNHVSLNGLFDIVLDRADRKDFDLVKKIIEFMLKIDKNFAPAYELYGSILIEEGDFNKGTEYLETSIKLEPWNVAALSELGETYFNLGEYDNAAKIWKKEINLSPDNYVTYFMLTDAYIEAKKLTKAAHVLEKFLNRFPKSILGKYELSGLYEKLSRTLEASELKDEIMKSVPVYSSDIEVWTKIMFEKNQFKKVQEFLEKYIENKKDHDHFKLLLVVPYIKSGKVEEAKKIYDEMKNKYKWYLYGLKEIMEKYIDKNLLEEMETK
ncbi:hypothetical protein OSSY52_17150 [Tepiditoga spiralis]|uniref:Uncharacterized protein n=1 Tax=Tepiditoga spiralis TaxID=2108365 RepID=A0A7G1G8L0_9BACT|nr:tetratricopeptide repeat protein [Tepiditoga spiralis]BBE31574.1 hypothetical protein OSSY52_17150 [Tepiditoga spiralis]